MAKKLTKAEKLKIIQNDPILWLKNFVKIRNFANDLIPFNVNKQQKYFIENMQKFNAICKSRQLGFTTLTLGLMLYYACTRPGTSYLVISYSIESVQNIFERLKDMYKSIPDEYKPEEVRNNRLELKLKNGSRITVKTAGYKDLGRSFTCEMILCSEFAFWPDDQQEKALLGLENALSKNDQSKIIIETTSNGFNYWHSLYKAAMKGESKYRAFFFSWIEDKEMFYSEYKLAEKWYMATYRDRLRERDLEKDEKILFDKGASLLQLMWRRYKLLDYDIEQFQQEFPATPEESFRATSRSVFSISKIAESLEHTQQHYTTSELIERGLEIPLSVESYIGKGFYIYSLPRPGVRYYGGVDTGSGNGGDNHAISIYTDDGEQVATFFNNKLPIYKFAEIAKDVGHLYNYCFYVVERNTYGLATLERLKVDHEYIQLYRMKTFVDGKKKSVLGWVTTGVSKQKLIQDFKEHYEKGLCNVICPHTLEEMKQFVEGEKQKMGSKSTFTDDLVIASALAIQGIKQGKWYI
ncbi:MAG: terminase family protein [Bacillus sp. (in: Bacteria)]|nr:terminase family protein [Bacillus sp. (in: firmicutes)]